MTAAGGEGIAVAVDHLDPAQVAALVARIDAEHGRLDVLVNDIWGAEHLFEWDTPVWEHDLDNGLRLLRLALDTHLITSHYALPLLIRRPGGLVVEITDGTARVQRRRTTASTRSTTSPRPRSSGSRWAQGEELAPHGGTAVALTPGLDALGDDARALRRDRGELARGVARRRTSASPRRRASSAAPSPRWPPTPTSRAGTAQSLSSGGLAQVYGFTDLDGTRPGLLALPRRGAGGGPARGRHRLPLSGISGDGRNRRSCGVVQDEAAEREHGESRRTGGARCPSTHC